LGRPQLHHVRPGVRVARPDEGGIGQRRFMRRLTLLTKADCELCEQAKAVVGRVAVDVALEVEVFSLESKGQRLAKVAGIVFPPGVLLDGEPFYYGRLSGLRLRRALRE
jgi:hypothetical protein